MRIYERETSRRIAPVRLQDYGRDPDILEKKKLIARILKGVDEITLDERKKFDHWLNQLPKNDLNNPPEFDSIDDIVHFLPSVPSSYEAIGFSFTLRTRQIEEKDLHQLMTSFCKTNPSFELKVIEVLPGKIWVSIGQKTRSAGSPADVDVECFGHTHPLKLLEKVENQDALPEPFVKGIMPSPGDVKQYLEHWEQIRKKPTRIYSPKGYSIISLVEPFHFDYKKFNRNLKEFALGYFDLFLGTNSFGIKSYEEVADYFKERFGLTITFNSVN